VTAVQYELVLQSQVQDKITELSLRVRQVCIFKRSYHENILFVVGNKLINVFFITSMITETSIVRKLLNIHNDSNNGKSFGICVDLIKPGFQESQL